MHEDRLPALAEPKQQHVALLSDLQHRLAEVNEALSPIRHHEAMAEIAGCLTLVAPAGMDADDRAEWLKVAFYTVDNISKGGTPQGALREACQSVRETCKRVSDLIPSIVAGTRDATARLAREAQNLRWQIDNPPRQQTVIEDKRDERPMTLAELLDAPAFLVSVARRNDWATKETFAAFDREMEKRNIGTRTIERETGSETNHTGATAGADRDSLPPT